MFLGIFPFPLGCPICWHILLIAASYDPLYFWGLGCNVSSLTYNFIYLSFLFFFSVQLISVTQSCLTLCDPMDRLPLPCPSPTPRVYSNSCSLSRWCHPTISSPSPPAFSLSQHQGLFKWVSSSYQVAKVLEFSASASVLPMNIQDWFPLGWTGWISLLSKGLSKVFSNTAVQKHQFFGTKLSL